MAKNRDDSHSFASYFKRATSAMVVLNLLTEKPAYAYEMSQALKARSGGRYVMSLLYPLLYRMEEQNFIEVARQEISPDNRVRNYYQITEKGREHLAQLREEYLNLVDAVEVLMNYSETNSSES